MRLTVPITVFNTRPDYLFEAVYSIANQTDGNEHRIILLDDHSTNKETLGALRLLSKKYEIIRSPKNLGLSGLLNFVHPFIETEFVARMDSDDICHADRFLKQIEYLKNHPETDILGTNLFGFKDADITRTPTFTTNHLEFPEHHRGWLVNHGTIVYRKSVIEAVGGYDETLRRGQDIELWNRLTDQGGCVFRNVTDVLYAWRRY